MSGLKPITVNTDPAAEAHIYAEDDAAIYESIFGTDGVLTIGQQCESQVISNNKVRVKDGVIVVGGHIARVPHGDYCDCEIANGQSGRNRNDIIIAKFVTTGSGGIDTYTLEIKQGAATTGDATDPALTQNNLYESGKIREMPLYRVKIEGLSIVGVEQMFEVVPTIPTLNAYLAELQNKYEGIKVTIKKYPMTLEPSSYVGGHLGRIQIPKEDLDKYGTIVGASFGGSSTAPGNAHVLYENSPNDTWVCASCVDATGTLRVSFIKT